MEAVEAEEVLAVHLRTHAQRYFPDLPQAEVSVELEGRRQSELSCTYFYRLVSDDSARSVVVKLPLQNGPTPLATRVRVAPVMDPARKFESEARTLELLQTHFDQASDPRFGAVRLLDFLGEREAVLMERCPEPTLRALLLASNRWRPGSRDLGPAFRNAGSWLRAYQQLEPLPHTQDRDGGRLQFIEAVEALCKFGGRPWLADVAAEVAAVARKELPEQLALGTAHGDLAPRNILVSASDRVTVLDTRAAWRAPELEDVGYFLASLWTSRVQAQGLGLVQSAKSLTRYEQGFLDGYFEGRRVPIVSVRLFEIQALLDRHASLRQRALSTPASALRSAAHWALERTLRRRILKLLATLPHRASA